ncbi:hypothetical protein [Streptomyces sp. NPDC056549]|uniref:hypothetical protein n=1 Tax=Streptomyces sp. NPDC056549 TaxID=3345864 RepID=UPI0036A0A3C5
MVLPPEALEWDAFRWRHGHDAVRRPSEACDVDRLDLRFTFVSAASYPPALSGAVTGPELRGTAPSSRIE